MLSTPTRRIALFFGMACAFAWPLVVLVASSGRGFDGGLGRAVLVLHAFAVALGAVIVQGPILKGAFIEPFAFRLQPNVYWLWALGLPLAAMLLAMLLASVLPGLELVTTTARFVELKRVQVLATDPSKLPAFEALLRENPPSHPFWLLLNAIPLGLTFNAVLGFVEELGWRGFILAHLPGSFWRRAFVSGALWGLFLVPAVTQGYLFPGIPLLGAVLIVAYALAFSPMIVWVRLRSKSIVAASLLRGMLLALTHVGYDLVHGEARWLQPLYGLTGILAAVLLTLALLLYETRLPHAERIMTTRPELG